MVDVLGLLQGSQQVGAVVGALQWILSKITNKPDQYIGMLCHDLKGVPKVSNWIEAPGYSNQTALKIFIVIAERGQIEEGVEGFNCLVRTPSVLKNTCILMTCSKKLDPATLGMAGSLLRLLAREGSVREQVTYMTGV
eukprot:TRINITY_DN62110_c0_g1_i1.p1 TRINITY_DN62110_c0_g1~~TRINITY_DN62110_c0_g1_i1.p1  ORF type:complete len:138 (+),score=27.98 TRINITY_DN62110_c0_g1_i1:485-898(+)